jgi:hypothetical protein
MIVVADTTPLNYLVLIDEAELLPALFKRVFLPNAAWRELQDPETPIECVNGCSKLTHGWRCGPFPPSQLLNSCPLIPVNAKLSNSPSTSAFPQFLWMKRTRAE